MRSNNKKLTWTSAVTFATLMVGCTLETVPVGENEEKDPAGTGAAGGNVIPSDADDGTGAAGGDVIPSDTDDGTGATGGNVIPSDANDGTGATGGNDEPDSGTGGSGAAGGDSVVQDPVVAAYCEMEAACIPTCVVEDGVVPCHAPERRDECLQIELPANDACEIAEAMWFECMAHLSCDEVQEFFAAHPDDIKPTTPCQSHMEYFCDDWEPPTEYSFN